MNSEASSMASTVKLLSTPSFLIAVMPSSMFEWRKPAVLVNSSALNFAAGSCVCGSALTISVRVTEPPKASVTRSTGLWVLAVV